jgi:hypothetical protein
MDTPEKHPQHSTMDPESPVSPISDPSAPHDNAHDLRTSMPKRKPVPTPTTAPSTDSTKETASKPKLAGLGATFSTLLSLNWYHNAPQRQKRKYLIFAAVAGILLLALIIGLAVGLTVGKK